MPITLTPTASAEVKSIIAAQNLAGDQFVRVTILGGGCSGLQYSLGFDTTYDPKIDARYVSDGIAIVTAKKFDLFLEDSYIDYLDLGESKGFSVENPNFPKGAGCAGCGKH